MLEFGPEIEGKIVLRRERQQSMKRQQQLSTLNRCGIFPVFAELLGRVCVALEILHRERTL